MINTRSSTKNMSQEIELFEKALKNVDSILKITGLKLHIDDTSESFMKRLRRRWFFCFALLWYMRDILAEVAWFIDGALAGKTLVELTYPLPCIAMAILANIKSYYFLKHEPCVIDLIRTLRMLQSITASGKNRKAMNKELTYRMSFLTIATKTQYWLNVVALSGYAILPFIIMTLTYLESGKVQLMLPYFVKFPFDARAPRVWPIMYIHQIWSSILITFTIFGSDSFYYACCTYIHMQFRYLHCDFEDIVEAKYSQRNNFKNEFMSCVERHKQLIRCVGLMETIYSKSTLFNVVSSSMLICLTGFNLTATPSWPLMLPFFAFIFLVSGQIYLFCYFGDIIMRSSTEVSEAVYNCKWYSTEVNEMKDLLFVLIRAQKPCKLTAFGFGDINLTAFTRILSTAWSYFALLSSVTTKT